MSDLTQNDLAARKARRAALYAAAKDHILVLDGAMGTMLQRRKLVEADYRGDRFKGANSDLTGNHAILNITRPDVIRDVYREYLEAGADIIETKRSEQRSVVRAGVSTCRLRRSRDTKKKKNNYCKLIKPT